MKKASGIVGGFLFFRAVEQQTEEAGAWKRPVLLARLCTASFINQGVVFPLYLVGLAGAYALRGMPEDEVARLIDGVYAPWLQPAQVAAMQAYVGMLRVHGVALMAVFALRTAVRFAGTLRMWHGRKDGLHLYIMAQLLGVLVPMLVAGRTAFNFFGFLIALNWCFLYFTQRKVLR
jgi:hypothetical protein